MSSGIQIFDESGNLTFTSSDSLARVVGSVLIQGGVNGSVSADLAGGRPYAIFQQNDNYWSVPTISVSASGVTWTWPTGFSQGGILFYGYY